jgi:EAL domain-containing protein (putative c-di-GMP-specific phosphodiesterase class I)
MRWNHPTDGPISPGIFIPSAEETGLIHDASRWALYESCAALQRIESAAGMDGELFMSVNFSGSDFGQEGFADEVFKAVGESKIKPGQLHIEITEGMLMSNPDMAKQTLRQFVDAGMHISIDDFGTGYSSLSYLHHFPINTMKIDRSFVKNMFDTESTMMLLKSIVGLAKNLNLEIIAEGIEKSEEADILRELGCDMVQGFFFAKPMQEDDAKQFVAPSSQAVSG